jgi:hypothetical protein
MELPVNQFRLSVEDGFAPRVTCAYVARLFRFFFLPWLRMPYKRERSSILYLIAAAVIYAVADRRF